MRKLLFWALAAIFTLTVGTDSASAGDLPAGMRMEIVEDEENDNVFSVFSYKDQDGTMGYYLGLGKELRISEELGIEIFGASFSHIDEVCLFIGATPDEALATLDGILKLFDQDVNTFIKIPARMTTGAEQLGDATMVNCTVRKKFITGKYLQFSFLGDKDVVFADLGKSTVKFLRKGLELDIKRHKK